MCNCVAFLQSASSCASSGGLLLLFCIHIDCNGANFPRCASWYAFWAWKIGCMNSCTECTCAVSPQSEWVLLQTIVSAKWLVTLCAFVRLLLSVHDWVSLQMMIQAKWLVAVSTVELLDPTVSLLVLGKTFHTCKCFRTRFTRYFIWHLQWSPPLSSCDIFWIGLDWI